MKSMKKSVIAVLVIGTLSVAGMALATPNQGKGQAGPMGPFGGPRQMKAQQWNGNNLPPAPPAGPGAPCFCGQRGPMGRQPAPFDGQGFGHRGGPRQERSFAPAFGQQEGHGPRGRQRGTFSPDMPQEIRAKAVEVAKLHIDLEEVLSQKPLNREKAIELNGQIGKLRQEIQAWRFEQKLGRIEEFNKKPAEDAGNGQDK